MKGILPATLVFQGGDRLFFLQMVYSAKLKKHMHLSKNPICLEEGASSTLLLYDNCIPF
jgi:hypothetical protein